MVELGLGQPAFEEGTGVDARRGVALEEDLVAHAVGVLAAEEVVEAHLVEASRAERTWRGGRRFLARDVLARRTMATAFQRIMPPDAQLHLLVARERRAPARARSC